MFCLAPLLLAGYMMTVSPFGHSSPNENGVIVELQTCERGAGGHVRASSSGLYALGLQYGIGTEFGPISLTFQPRAGFSHVDHENRNLPLGTQFELGGQMLVGYDRYRFAVDYWHLSNAGIKKPNLGMDTFSVMVGVAF